jgi:hypothetical protein
MGFRNGKEKLPALKGCSAASRVKAFLIDLLDRVKAGIHSMMPNVLRPEFRIHLIVHFP